MDEVTRERAQSFLTDEHIDRIVKAYRAFKDDDGSTRVVGLEEIRSHDYNLSIPLYVRPEAGSVAEAEGDYGESLAKAIEDWQQSSAALRKSMDELILTLKQAGLTEPQKNTSRGIRKKAKQRP